MSPGSILDNLAGFFYANYRRYAETDVQWYVNEAKGTDNDEDEDDGGSNPPELDLR